MLKILYGHVSKENKGGGGYIISNRDVVFIVMSIRTGTVGI